MRIEHTQDVSTIVPLGEQWLAECSASDFGIKTSMAHIIKDLENWIEMATGTIILAYDGVELVGFMSVFVVPSVLGPQMFALEKYWYALAGRPTAGPMMFVEASRWAKENNCSHLIMSASHIALNIASNVHDKCCKFYERMGMKIFETSYICEV